MDQDKGRQDIDDLDGDRVRVRGGGRLEGDPSSAVPIPRQRARLLTENWPLKLVTAVVMLPRPWAIFYRGRQNNMADSGF